MTDNDQVKNTEPAQDANKTFTQAELDAIIGERPELRIPSWMTK